MSKKDYEDGFIKGAGSIRNAWGELQDGEGVIEELMRNLPAQISEMKDAIYDIVDSKEILSVYQMSERIEERVKSLIMLVQGVIHGDKVSPHEVRSRKRSDR